VVVKYNPKTGIFSFIKSSDFNSNPEPIIDEWVNNKTHQKSGKIIYHHKWQFVDDNYDGFDVEQSKQHSLHWTIIVNKNNIPKSKIGSLNFWNTQVAPLL
jgi:hypothetical protein